MKKLILMIVAVTCLAYQGKAQEDGTEVRDRFMFGLKAGTNYSNVYDTKGEEFDAEAKFGIAAGAFVAIPIGKYFGIQPEILFSQKGIKAKGNLLGSTYDFTRTTSYIDLPLLIAVKPVEFLTLVAGPQYSYLLNQKYDFENEIINIEQEEEFENEDIRKNTLSLVGGIDFNLNHVVLGARAGWDITDNNEDGTSTTPRYKNVWLQATIGYRFYN